MRDSTPDQAQILKLIENIYQFDRNDQISEFSDISDADRAHLQPHLEIAEQNRDRYAQAQSQLAQLQQILPYLNTITLAPDGKIAYLSDNAQALLKKYLPDQPIQPQLPTIIQRWFQSQRRKPTMPLRLLHNENCLVIRYVPSHLGDRLILTEQPALHINPKSFESIGLTTRESEILFYVAQGYENQTIGDILHIHPLTVKTHLSNITDKLLVDSRLAAVTKALQQLGINISHWI